MKEHDSSIKQAIQHLDWALDYLEDCTFDDDLENPDEKVVDNCFSQIRKAHRELKDLL